jgi:hypothetical protein
VRTLRDELQEGREESRLSLHELREAVLASELQSLTSSADTTYSGDSNMDSIRWARLELKPVLGIRIRRTRMFLGIPDPDTSVRGMDLDPDPSLFL